MKDNPNDGKKEKVRQMFNLIAYRYDFLNHFLSFGTDFLWRKKLVNMAKPGKPKNILDIATGTGDLAIALARLNPQKIIGSDISEEMLKIGIQKIHTQGLDHLIGMKVADAEALPFDNEVFDLVTAAFGVRNFENLDVGLKEMSRVTKPGGTILILEFSTVTSFPWKQAFNIYFKGILPLIGKVFSKHDFAYRYLPESVGVFPYGLDFLHHLEQAGYIETSQRRLTGGIATIYRGVKK